MTTARRSGVALALVLAFTICFPKAGLKIAGVYPVTVGYVLTLIAFVWSQLIRDRQRGFVRGRRPFMLLTAYLTCWTLVSCLWFGLGPTLAVAVPFLAASMLGAWCIDRMAAIGPERSERIVVGCVSVAVAYGLAQHLFGRVSTVVPGLTVNLTDWRVLGETVFSSKNNSTPQGLKLVGAYQNGNLFSELFVLYLPWIAARSIVDTGRAKLGWLTLLAGSSACCVLTLSRGGALFTAVGVTITIALLGRGRMLTAVAIGSVAMIVAGLDSLADRLGSLDSAGRVEVWNVWVSEVFKLDAAAFLQFVTVGLGPGYDALRDLKPDQVLGGGMVPMAESGLLGILTFWGGIGVVLWYRPIVGTAWRCAAELRPRSGFWRRRALLAGAAGGLVAQALHSIIEQSIFLPATGALTMTLVALVASTFDAREQCANSIDRTHAAELLTAPRRKQGQLGVFSRG